MPREDINPKTELLMTQFTSFVVQVKIFEMIF